MKRMVETKAVELIESMAAKNVTTEMILAPKIEDLVDADGHKRFQEWDGYLPTPITGVNITFSKASLSGSHLMLVVAGEIADGTIISNGSIMQYVDLPAWIMDKIIPIWNTNIEGKSVRIWADDWTYQDVYAVLAKGSDKLAITTTGNVTANKDRKFRFQFDLLID